MRIQNRRIPNTPRLCPFWGCVYNESHECDNPQINRGNSDARCHKMNPAQIITHLTMRAVDVWDSARFSSIFLASGLSCSQAFS